MIHCTLLSELRLRLQAFPCLCSSRSLPVCHTIFFYRMRSRRAPVLRLGSRNPGGDPKSLRLWTQAPQSPASVRGGSDMPETKIVAKRRTVVTFYVSYYQSVNSHRDPGGRGRETQNCGHFVREVKNTRRKNVVKRCARLVFDSCMFVTRVCIRVRGSYLVEHRTLTSQLHLRLKLKP